VARSYGSRDVTAGDACWDLTLRARVQGVPACACRGATRKLLTMRWMDSSRAWAELRTGVEV
jgi:hypothetical protein